MLFLLILSYKLAEKSVSQITLISCEIILIILFSQKRFKLILKNLHRTIPYRQLE
jgi:hypothetical protein